ncbi:MAG: hypothetical protein K0U74_00780 [Alphaproteobacteria bacterium]|nr:hypothetical protein [Alphaproteobacteria bacterium]
MLQPSWIRWQAVLVGACVIAGAVASQPARSEGVELSPAQKTLLELQLKESYKCVLGKVLFAREVEVGGTVKLDGRAQCTDEREVDFTQASPNAKFELSLCQPTVC